MNEASSMATSARLELDKLKKVHAAELRRADEEKVDAVRALAVAEAKLKSLEDEVSCDIETKSSFIVKRTY